MNSDNVKKVDFLKHDLNPHVDHQMVKSNKSLYNFKKKDLYNHHHSTLHDFTINAKNTFADHPFTGSANWYVDFELPSLNYLYDSFVLRYKLSNDVNGNVVQILPSPFHLIMKKYFDLIFINILIKIKRFLTILIYNAKLDYHILEQVIIHILFL